MLVLTNPGARGHRLRALGRMWGWQIWRRVPGRPILVSFSSGTRLYFPPWSMLAGHVAATGSHEPSEQAFLAALVRPGDVAVDVGANIGIYTVALAAMGARVAAFEPGTQARSVLAHNLALNASTDHVEVFPFALGDRDGSALLATALDGANHLEEGGGVAGSTEPVEIRTLDTVVEAHGSWFDGLGPLVVKIDAEGHDEEVLRGGRRLRSGIGRWSWSRSGTGVTGSVRSSPSWGTRCTPTTRSIGPSSGTRTSGRARGTSSPSRMPVWRRSGVASPQPRTFSRHCPPSVGAGSASSSRSALED